MDIYSKVILVPAILIAFAFHEFAHAFVADKLGDKTPRFEGRLTLNPMEHIDIMGFLMIILIGFGWAKPVRTNPSAYKNYYRDDFLVSIAGPIGNFIVSLLFSIILGLYLGLFNQMIPVYIANVLQDMIVTVISLNVGLGIFNLLPIPGFDGFNILKDIFKERFYPFEEKIYKYNMIILIGAVYLARYIIPLPASIIMNGLSKIILIIVGIF